MNNVTATIEFINSEIARMTDAINNDFDGELTAADVQSYNYAMAQMGAILNILDPK